MMFKINKLEFILVFVTKNLGIERPHVEEEQNFDHNKARRKFSR